MITANHKNAAIRKNFTSIIDFSVVRGPAIMQAGVDSNGAVM